MGMHGQRKSSRCDQVPILTALNLGCLPQDSWSATVQLVLLIFTALVVLGLVPLVLLTTNRLSSAMFSPVKTPTASAPQVGGGQRWVHAALVWQLEVRFGVGTADSKSSLAQHCVHGVRMPTSPGTSDLHDMHTVHPSQPLQNTAESHKRRTGLQSLSPPKRPCFSPFTDRRQGTPASAAGEEAAAAGPQSPWWAQCRAAWRTVRAAAGGVLGGLEAGLRSTLRANVHALVALLLILGLFVGTTGLAAFLSVRVAQEGRATVMAVRDVFPAAWAGMAASTPLLADAVAAAGGGSSGGSGNSSSGGGTPAAPVLPPWVASYQKEALQLVQQALPAIASWGESHFQGFVEKQNLTSALG